jgi:hypothetical protein
MVDSKAMSSRPGARPREAGHAAAACPTAPDSIMIQLRQAQEAGDATPGVDARCEAQTLLAVARDLGGDILLDSRTVVEALALLDYHLDRIFAPERRDSRSPADQRGKLGAKDDRNHAKVGKQRREPEM